VVDNGSDSVSFLGWDSEVTDWRRPAGFIRTSGEWRQSGDVVSVVGGFDGPALVLVENGVISLDLNMRPDCVRSIRDMATLFYF